MSDPVLGELIASLGGETFVSIEFFPPKTDAGVTALYSVLAELKAAVQPLFVDVTWGAGGSTSGLTFDICKTVKEKYGLITNMHLTCTNVETGTISDVLSKCRAAGITNILALRGDPPSGQEWQQMEGGFSCALSLIEHIRREHGDFFGVSCAGYPEGHPSAMTELLSCEGLTESELQRCSCTVDESGTRQYSVCLDAKYRAELAYLKQKVAAGATVIITQMFFDVSVFESFVKDCRECGVNVPILPGLMLISSYAGFNRMVKFCKTKVPENVMSALDAIRDDEKLVREYGVRFGIDMCKQLIAIGAPGLHFYTLNSLQPCSEIVNGLVNVLPSLESRQR